MKVVEKMKENKKIIGISAIILLICILFFVLIKIEPPITQYEEKEEENTIRYFETPDRIIYKLKNEDKYYVFKSNEKDYDEILNQLIKCIDSINDGYVLSKEDIKQIEEKENYIELDYNKISKNYIICYEKENYNVIKRTDEGGVVVKGNIKQKTELEKLIVEKINNREYYEISDIKTYNIEELVDNAVTNNLLVYENGIFGKILKTKEEWEQFKKDSGIVSNQDILDGDFERYNVLLMATKYQIDKIDTRVGGVTLHFTGKPLRNQCYVNMYLINKAININCIYRNLDNVEPEEQLHGEELKQQILKDSEVAMKIKNLTKKGNDIIITGELDNYYTEEIFEVNVTVNKDTMIFGKAENQYEELEKLQKRGDVIFITFNYEKQLSGKLVALNIEVMGC